MVGTVARTPMAMAPPVVARQEMVERREQVGVGACAKLHDNNPGGGVWDEDGEEAVVRVDLGQEACARVGQVDDRRFVAGLDRQLATLHQCAAPQA